LERDSKNYITPQKGAENTLPRAAGVAQGDAMKDKTIVQQHKRNFETLKAVFKNDDVALVDCIEKSTGEHVAVLCAMTFDGKEYTMTPFAKFFNGNPFELLLSPMEFDRTVTP
jgi:hypothetical protein